MGSEVSYHRRGFHWAPQETGSEALCERLPGEDSLTREREKNRTEQRKKFNCDAVAKGALAHPSGK